MQRHESTLCNGTSQLYATAPGNFMKGHEATFIQRRRYDATMQRYEQLYATARCNFM